MNAPAEVLARWIEAVEQSAQECLISMLGLDSVELSTASELPDGDQYAAFVAVITDESCVQIGLALREEDCRKMAKRIFMVQTEEDSVSDEDMADSLGELANIIAGTAKAKVSDSVGRLGLPLQLRGRLLVTNKQFLATRQALADDIKLNITLLLGDRSLNFSDDSGQQVRLDV